jgi:hypothetical protein
VPRCVVSHPYDVDGGTSNAYEVLTLSEDGRLTAGPSFEMGRAQLGRIAFTPDGRVGIAPQEDGSLGVFRLDDDGRPTVVNRAFHGSFFASAVIMHPSGESAWVLDSQWAKHGGGIYEIRIEPNGALRDDGLQVEAKLPYGMLRLPAQDGREKGGHRFVLASYDILGSSKTTGLHLVDLAEEPRRLASVDVFGDYDAIMSSMAITSDGRYVLVGDSNGYSGVPNRIAVVSLEGDRPTMIQAFTPILDPVAIVASPFGGPVLVVSGFGDAVYVLDYDPEDRYAPFSYRGELDYVGERPGLPSCAVRIEEGRLAGHVLIGENGGIRQLDFVPSGEGVIDRGIHGLETAAGAVGIALSVR